MNKTTYKVLSLGVSVLTGGRGQMITRGAARR